MFRRLSVGLLVVAFSTIATQVYAAAPTLLSAVSRISHGNIAHDVQLPLSGGTGIECRGISNGLTILLTFDQPVNAGSASITLGTAVAGTPTFSNYTMTVPVTGLINAEAVTLTVSNVLNANKEALASAAVPFRTLFADINGDGILNVVDITLVRGASATGAVTNGTFRADLNLDNVINVTDVTLVRGSVAAGASVDGGATNNTAPTITQISNQTAVTGVAMLPVGFTVGDNESDPSLLAVTATSSDQLTIPNNAISVTGTGASRSVTLTPAVGVTAVTPVTITMYASDGLASSTPMTFTVNVTPPPMTYLATLAPISGVTSLGSGTALLIVSGDQTYASIKYGYSNLSSADTDDAIYDNTDAVMYDIPVGRARGDLQLDGSLKWTFSTTKQASILASIQSNSSYILLESATYPNGELKGIFKLITGSQVFTPPQPPPAITINPPTPADASRFLQQAAFGGNGAEIAKLSSGTASNASTAINDWLTAQYAQPMPIYPTYSADNVPPTTQASQVQTAQSTTQPYSTSSTYARIYNRICTPQGTLTVGDSLNDDRMHEEWWRDAISSPDPLRQRVATALSEIFVVSEIDGTIDDNIPGLASYYDMLGDDAFGNFRTLLGDVTLHPIMGHYLNMLGNTKTIPNENYAREIMQLFSIGLYMLNPDGTLQLDSTGAPIPTYSQPLVTSFAAVYTGWTYPTTRPVLPELEIVSPATQPSIVPFTSYYQQPMALTATNHSSVAKQLLTYSGAKTYGAATQPAFLPATTGTMTATVANAELNFALDNIFNHPNVGPFISKQLIQRLVESNPSPAYVYRVAQVFNNDGTGVRGNMKAVITAILTDYEARSPAVQTSAGYGHMREPMIRMADIMHSVNAISKTGRWAIGKTDSTLNQTIFRSPTVFNFYDPSYSEPGAVQSAGLVSPELDIIFETTITNAQNMVYTGINPTYYTDNLISPIGTAKSGTGWRGDAYGSDVYLDLSTTGSNLVGLDQSTGPKSTALLNQVVLLLNGGPLDSNGAAQARIQTVLDGITGTTITNSISRVNAALYLVATASQTAAER